jgi:hypothetical protein
MWNQERESSALVRFQGPTIGIEALHRAQARHPRGRDEKEGHAHLMVVCDRQGIALIAIPRHQVQSPDSEAGRLFPWTQSLRNWHAARPSVATPAKTAPPAVSAPMGASPMSLKTTPQATPATVEASSITASQRPRSARPLSMRITPSQFSTHVDLVRRIDPSPTWSISAGYEKTAAPAASAVVLAQW